MNPKEWKIQLRAELRKVYEGILPEETLNKGNPWFEDFTCRLLEAVAVSCEGEKKTKLMLPELSRTENDIKIVREQSFNSALDTAANLIRSLK